VTRYEVLYDDPQLTCVYRARVQAADEVRAIESVVRRAHEVDPAGTDSAALKYQAPLQEHARYARALPLLAEDVAFIDLGEWEVTG
jgi:hypothetical protein